MAMRVVVTGGAGHLGSAVCEVLAEAGLDVLSVDRVYERDLPVRQEVANLLDGPGVYRLLRDREAVVHLANIPNPFGPTPPQQLYSDNVTMDMNVFQAAVELGARKLIFSSSVQAFSGSRSMDEPEVPSCLPYLPVDGDVPTRPGNAYALSKAAGEQQLRYFAALDPGLACAALRFPVLLSEWNMRWLRRAGRQRWHRYGGNPDEGFSYLTVKDAGRLVLAILGKLPAGYHQFFPATTDSHAEMSVPELIEKYYRGVPLRVPVEKMTSLIDISAVTQQLGWVPQDTGIFRST
jgi:nucleoside-diphosphate-sugar epimerase